MSTSERALVGGALAVVGVLIIVVHSLNHLLEKHTTRGGIVGGLVVEGVGTVLALVGGTILEPVNVPPLLLWGFIALLFVLGLGLASFTLAPSRAATASDERLALGYGGAMYLMAIAVTLSVSELFEP